MITTDRPTVLALLRAAPPGLLADALAHRPDLAAAAPGSVSELADRVVRPSSVLAALDGVDRWARQVAEAAVVCGGPTSAAAIASLLRIADGSTPSVAEIEHALDRLVERLVVFRDGDHLWLNPGLLGALGEPAGLGPPVRALLEPMTADELRGLATRLGGVGKAKRKAELFELVLSRLADPALVAGVIEQAPAAAAKVLRAARSARVDLPYGAGYWRVSASPGRLDDPHRWLLGHGLLVGSSWDHAVVPREVGLALRGGVIRTDAQPAPPRLSVIDADEDAVDRAGSNRAAAVAGLVGRLLEELANRPAEPLKAGGLGAREVKRLAKATDADPSELRLALELGRVAGLVPPAWEPVAPTSAGEAWTHDEPATQWLALATAWLADDDAPLSLNGTKDPQGDSIPSGVAVHGLPARPLREAILAVLGELEPGRAVADGMHGVVSWRSAAYVDRLGIDPELGGRLVDWIVAEASAVGLVASGAVTSVGRALLVGDIDAAATAASELLRPAPATIIVQADHTIVVDAGAPRALLAELRVLADVESTGAALVMRITPASVRRALDFGRSGEQLLSLLTEHAAAGVPQPIAYLIDDTARRWGQVRTGRATCYVRGADAAVLAEVVAHRKLAQLGLRLLAPTVAVSDEPHDTVLGALRDAGFLPAAEGSDGAVVAARPVRHRSTVTRSAVPARAATSAAAPMTVDERRALVATLLAAPDAPAREPATGGRAPANGRRGQPQGVPPGLFDSLGMDDVRDMLAAALGGRPGWIDDETFEPLTELDDLDLDDDDVDDLDGVDDELVESMVAAEVDGGPVELLRLEAGTLRSVTGRVLVFDEHDLAAIVAQEPGGVEVVVDLADVVAFRSLGPT